MAASLANVNGLPERKNLVTRPLKILLLAFSSFVSLCTLEVLELCQRSGQKRRRKVAYQQNGCKVGRESAIQRHIELSRFPQPA